MSSSGLCCKLLHPAPLGHHGYSWQLNLPAPDPSRGRMQGRLAPGQAQLVQFSGFLPAQHHQSLQSGCPESQLGWGQDII